MTFCVVGSGFTGSVLARHLADRGYRVTVVDERPHPAGNCYTERDPETGVMVHRYGPHIFHTANLRVWDYVQRFGTFSPYINRVKAIAQGRVFSLPINLLTINQFFGTAMGPEEARTFIERKTDTSIINPKSFEEQALRSIGSELYRAFFHGYTRKQWGREPSSLPASVFRRLPLRFDYDDNYFHSPYQGMPVNGYTALIENILNHSRIDLRLSCSFEQIDNDFTHVFYTGPIDRYFDFRPGRLAYRTVEFERFVVPGDYQGTGVINYCDKDIPFTRISEHKYFMPWEQDHFEKTVCFREYSREAGKGDAPYYPIRLTSEKRLLATYQALAHKERGVSFLGRLGTYRYLDMDVSIGEALSACDRIDEALQEDVFNLPVFFIDPEGDINP
ncbi:FAD-dependent oxidoreductase [Acetobacter conturbans]|uniref:NAD(P)-binding protein n=1 Tax=Acetobacter conturbans TaxID=1737472 RepID=A0ABX0K0A8_9PROT|nr:NAD(P)-binding protein [Acetobacter conturbans]